MNHNHRPPSLETTEHRRLPASPPRGSFPWAGVLVAVLVTALLGTWAFLHFKEGDKDSGADHLPTVAVAIAKKNALQKTVSFSAEFHPYQNVELHAKVAGYVKEIRVDIGDHVKAGETLAILEIPELQDDLHEAAAAVLAAQQAVTQAEANYTDAHLAYTRLAEVGKSRPNLIAQQDLDAAQARDQGTAAALAGARNQVDVAKAKESREKALLDYSTITAPFDGVVTHRYADVGSLVQAGTTSDTTTMPVVTVAQENLLRLDFPVDEPLVPQITDGKPVEITITALNQTFPSKITRFTQKIDQDTRTMIAEVEVPNDHYVYTPGMYATVKLILGQAEGALTVPVQAIIPGTPPSVMVLQPDHKIEKRTVKIGMQTAYQAQVLEGLQENEQVVVAHSGQFKPGDEAIGKVIPTPTASSGDENTP